MQGALQTEECLLETHRLEEDCELLHRISGHLVATRADACLGCINRSKEVDCLLIL